VAVQGGRVVIGVDWNATGARSVTAAPEQPALQRLQREEEPAAAQGRAGARGSRGARPLAGCRIALAEVREADMLENMLVDQGATTISYPLVRIADTPDHDAVLAFLHELADGGLDALVLLTGEGVRRLIAFAERAGLADRVIVAMRGMTIISRGPKPARALRELRILPTLPAEQPTTEGVIEALQLRDWRGARVGVQLCGQKPNDRLLGFLTAAGAVVRPVAPYVYVHASDDDRVVQLIRHMSMGEIDAVAFTCSAQVERVFAVAKSRGVEDTLRRGFRRTRVAALGPVVAAALRERDCSVDIIPTRSFFMRSLTREIVAALKSPRSPAKRASVER
jgi:uroporphyrinogen-III synthase